MAVRLIQPANGIIPHRSFSPNAALRYQKTGALFFYISLYKASRAAASRAVRPGSLRPPNPQRSPRA